ncbi:hypothetical protein [Streptomyces sp. NBC_00568]|uniref:hypothetical protein n=1 Tax=Streptomyces sp. NBC_00568 TaxID=2975779 RepID=UPI0022544AC1|nr:hypothetical protein [Streptomyces sp. NBC_00568]MCX4993397.1 hypothetical protein [Streptomyces sp. NBC_00568]
MPKDAHTHEWTHPPYDDQDGAPILGDRLFTVACAAVLLLGDQWGAAAGPGGRTGHLRTNHTVFTIGVCEAGGIFLRNDNEGDVRHLPHVDANSSPDDIAEAVAAHVGDLY